MIEQRPGELEQPGELDLGLGLDSGRGHDGHRLGEVDGVPQERRLTDPCLAANQERAAPAVARIGEQALDPLALRASPDEHRSMLLRRRPEAKAALGIAPARAIPYALHHRREAGNHHLKRR